MRPVSLIIIQHPSRLLQYPHEHLGKFSECCTSEIDSNMFQYDTVMLWEVYTALLGLGR